MSGAAEFDESSLTPYDAARRARVEIEARLRWEPRSADHLTALKQELAGAIAREQDLLRDAMTVSDSELTMLEHVRDRIAAAAHLPFARDAVSAAQADLVKAQRALQNAKETERLLRSFLCQPIVAQESKS